MKLSWFKRSNPASMLAMALSVSNVVVGLELDITSQDSIKSAASTIAWDMMTYYRGNYSGQIPGELPGPPPDPTVTNAGYFWWECGAMFGTLVDYWYYTGDSSYNQLVIDGMMFQKGDNDFLPGNQSKGMGNDDQGFWGMSAMMAAELNFPNPPADQPGWLALVQGVYNTQIVRFDDLCGGGLHWQAYTTLNGYNYKNSIANGVFFNLAARLALYTGNSSYAAAAVSTYDWVSAIGFLDAEYNVYDGADSLLNCTNINKAQFSYNAGVFLLGAAAMYNYSNADPVWETRVNGLLNRTIEVFFPNGIGTEGCEANLPKCTIDMLSYKAYLVRWMAAATKWAPFITDSVMSVIKTSSVAAAKQCSGSPGDHPNGRMCGLTWSKGDVWDGSSGVGQQMAALEVIQSNLIVQSKSPVTNTTGGTSQGDPNAGQSDISGAHSPIPVLTVTTGDRAGAGFLTAAVACGIVGTLAWLSMPDLSV